MGIVFHIVFTFIVRMIIIQAYSNTFTNANRQFDSKYRKILSKMVNILNEGLEPCDDFFQHSCDYYNIEFRNDDVVNNVDSSSNTPPPFLYNIEGRVEFFEEHKADFGTPVGKILRDLYEDCKARDRYDVLNGLPQSQWKRMLHEIRFLAANNTDLYADWPFLRYQWDELKQRNDLNWIILAAKFAAHGIPSFLNIFFGEGTIYIGPVNTIKCDSLEQITTNLIAFMHNASRNSQIAEIIGHELWQFCRELTGQLLRTDDIDDATTVDILIDDTIVEYFENFFGILRFSASEVENARKIPLEKNRLAGILTVMRSAEPRIIYNFVLWHAYEQLRYEDCFQLTEEFPQLLQSEYWHWYAFESNFQRDVAMATYLYHTTRFQRYRRRTLMSEHWNQFLYMKSQRKDLNMERLIKTYANSNLNLQNLSAIYGGAVYKRGNFYWNLLMLRRKHLHHTFFTPIIDTDDLNHPAYFLQQFLNFCILLVKQPLFHYYATQDLYMWQESNLLYTTDGLYTAYDCLEQQTHLYQDDDEAALFKMLSLAEVEETFHFYQSFHEAYRDYRFWLEGESFAFAEDFILNYFQMDSKSILFYAVAQLYCGRNDALYRVMINRSFMNMPAFQKAFDCTSNSPMNPTMKCLLTKCNV